jgi:serine/threonine protein kinase
MPGEKIGQYRVLERLGAGGMGHVYRAVDEMLGREAALKIIATPEEDGAARLRSEAAALARLSHPGIATVYELIEDDGQLVLAMELVRGRTLQQILEQVGVFSPRQAADVCMQTLAVLEHAHAAGIVHRDLKPGNLMLTDSGAIKIMDFGIAHAHDSLGLTNAGAMIGTPAYMAPEQVLGQPIDARTDVYAMGVVLFRLVTAALPFKGDTPFEMTQSQVNDAPAKATDVRADLPAWVEEILARALAKQPADRFQSAGEFQAALANAIAIETPQPAATAAVEVTEVMVRPELSLPPAVPASRPTATWQTAAAVAVLAAGTWFTTSGASPVRPPEPAASSPVQIASVEPPAAMPVSTLPVAIARKPATKPAPSPVATVPTRAPVSFTGAKMIAVNGSRISTSDVVLLLSDTEVSIHSQDDSGAPTVLPYRGIVKATYAQGRDPKWDAGLSAPAGRVDVPGIGILSRTRHWLVLQGPDRYVILRLDGVDRADVMRAFEERAGIAIDRPNGVK